MELIRTVKSKHETRIGKPAIDIPDFITGAFKGMANASVNQLDFLVLISTLLMLVGGAFLVYELRPNFEELHANRINSTWGFTFIIITVILLILRGAFFLYNGFLYLKYKPISSVTDELLPTCTVIVPAYNEGRQVWNTLMSLAHSDYPTEKLQIIAIDDGSKDDTWQWMLRAKQELGGRVEIYQQSQNKGKRHALYRGFHLGIGEIFVTVDSDSVVKPDTLRCMTSPFVVNKTCGAVAGNVHVLNYKNGIIPKMLNVSFVFSFEFVRAAQSMLGSVLCTPGALSAYRKNAVMKCLPEWINQTFMGQPSDIGEDRAMTNMLLKQGYHVLFQQNAYVLTNVPEKYSGLYKMFIRWERSNVRENIAMGNFVFKNFRSGSKAGPRILFFNQWIKIITAYPFTVLMFLFILSHPVLFLSSTLFSILILSSIPVFFYARRYNTAQSLWAYSYSILYTFGLFWITPYAIATASKKGWLTRGL